MNNAVDVITDYREQKKKLEQLAAAARKQMQARYTELLAEAGQIQSEFKSAFGANPLVPDSVRSFTLFEGKKPAATDAQATGKKIGGLRRSLNAAIKRNDSGMAIKLVKQLEALGVPATLPPDTVPADPAYFATPDGIETVAGPGTISKGQ